jgi:hypothetical protein
MIDLQRDARPDERFHLSGAPTMSTYGRWDWLYRRVEWYFPAGQHFHTSILLWVFRWYRGEAKVDGTRTQAYWAGVYGQPVYPSLYVATTTDKEMFSVRLSVSKPDRERVLNMGGI